MNFMTDFLLPVMIIVVLPIAIVLIITKGRLKIDNNRNQLIQAALEKDPNYDVNELIKTLDSKGKTIKEKMLNKLSLGCIAVFLGIGFLVFSICLFRELDLKPLLLASIVLIAVGFAFIANYFACKKLLAKEIEAEEQSQTDTK